MFRWNGSEAGKNAGERRRNRSTEVSDRALGRWEPVTKVVRNGCGSLARGRCLRHGAFCAGGHVMEAHGRARQGLQLEQEEQQGGGGSHHHKSNHMSNG